MVSHQEINTGFVFSLWLLRHEDLLEHSGEYTFKSKAVCNIQFDQEYILFKAPPQRLLVGLDGKVPQEVAYLMPRLQATLTTSLSCSLLIWFLSRL